MSRQNRNTPFSTGIATTTPPNPGTPKSTGRPTPDAIRKRAYELYCARKGQGGTPEDDWFRAERELTGRA